MPRLILLNGPPACGKSTLAQRYVDDHPLSVNLDVDRLRSLIGGWQADPTASGLLARAMAIAAARAHLAAGCDVIIPQYVGRPDFIERVARLAVETGAIYSEIVLLDSKENAAARFADRSLAALDPAHREAQELLDASGGADALSAMYDRLISVIASRPGVRIVGTVDGQIEATYLDLLAAISQS